MFVAEFPDVFRLAGVLPRWQTIPVKIPCSPTVGPEDAMPPWPDRHANFTRCFLLLDMEQCGNAVADTKDLQKEWS